MRFKTFFPIIVFFLVVFLVSCQGTQEQTEPEKAAPAVDMTQVRAAIEGVNLEFSDAVREGDAVALAALYTEDARLLPPNSEMITGREGVQAFWDAGIQMGIDEAFLTTVEIIRMGDLICEIGKYNLVIQPEEGEGITDEGKYIVIWKKVEDGNWKLHVDIWNTSLPPQ